MRKLGPKHPIRHRTQPVRVVDHYFTVRLKGQDALWSGMREERGYEIAGQEADRAQEPAELLCVQRVHVSESSVRSDRTLWVQDVFPFAEVALETTTRPRPSALAERLVAA